jgi:hypothetical protein
MFNDWIASRLAGARNDEIGPCKNSKIYRAAIALRPCNPQKLRRAFDLMIGSRYKG